MKTVVQLVHSRIYDWIVELDIGMSGDIPSKKRKIVHLDVKLDENELDNGDGSITSKFFQLDSKESVRVKKEPGSVGSEVDFSMVKSLSSTDYFDRMDDITNDDPKQWSVPLPDDIINGLKSNEKVPQNFIPIFSRVRLMRSEMVTPVDTMGCPRIPLLVSKKFGITRNKLRPVDYRVQLLVSLILSSQTKDETVTKAMYNIMDHCFNELHDNHGISLSSLSVIEIETLEQLIKSTGFYKRKAFYIKQTVKKLQEEFEMDVPLNIQGMLSLPGVGPKIGHLALQKSWGKIDGICVDVHVHRLCNMWRWVDSDISKTAEHTRISVEEWLPQELWYDFNTILVGFGQIICGPKTKRCDLCLANQVCNASKLRNK